ncbi:GNAT family N-acetyltransferase [Defluviimonas salinarum]|uniref:GNAT family N-acetyltransferase n=1 Tax=Defluviimonas salinarum TaxID=2992147 RepID=A0ABT3J7M9_9RHOB|nr:GNAT family N-acetyltransferase [Defluviimonas salinarum]
MRRITPEEAALWRRIRLLALATAPEAFSTRHAEWESRPLADFAAQIAANPVFLAFDNAEPVGSASWSRDTELQTRGWLTSVFVAPSARGRGHAPALIVATLADAAAAGIREMRLEVGAANRVAQEVYAKVGFAPVPASEAQGPSCGRCEIMLARALP